MRFAIVLLAVLAGCAPTTSRRWTELGKEQVAASRTTMVSLYSVLLEEREAEIMRTIASLGADAKAATQPDDIDMQTSVAQHMVTLTMEKLKQLQAQRDIALAQLDATRGSFENIDRLQTSWESSKVTLEQVLARLDEMAQELSKVAAAQSKLTVTAAPAPLR